MQTSFHLRTIPRMCARCAGAIVLALVLIQVPLTVHAGGDQVTPDAARRAALAWLHICPDFAGGGEFEPLPTLLEIKDAAQQHTIAYVLQLQPAGYIIITPSFDLNPVIAYSTRSVFDAAETPDNVLLDLLRGDIGDRLRALAEGTLDPVYLAVSRARWDAYLDTVDGLGRLTGSGTTPWQAWDVSYGPFLTSTWSQSTVAGEAVWNYYTPPYAPGDPDNYVCGCVATAAGQILNYYEWPVTGTGSHSYLWNGQTLSADFGATTYDWAGALDSYGSGSTVSQRQAAGLVTYHAGVAVDMAYSASGSGAVTGHVADALSDYFRASGEWVAGTEADFYARLYANMANARPGQLAIRSTTNAGHSVVIDGVHHNISGDTTRYYHLNMGWGGYADDWYNIAGGFNAGGYTWNTISGAVLDVVPTPDMADPGATLSDSSFPVSWDVADLQAALSYHLQQAVFPADSPLGSFTDGAESGTGSWTIKNLWDQSATFAHPPSSYSFHGQVYNGQWLYPGTMTLDQMVLIDSTTTIDYYWSSYYGLNQQLRLEISADGASWTTLASHVETATTYPPVWHAHTVSSGELAAYVATPVSLRFVIDLIGSSAYGGAAGFYVDDITISNARYAGWETVSDQIPSESRTVVALEDGTYHYRVQAVGCNPSVEPSCTSEWWDFSDRETVVVSGLYNSVTSGTWHTPGTWEPSSVPGATNSAVVNMDHVVYVDGAAECHDLTVDGGGMVVVADTATLGVLDDLTNDGTLQQTQDVNGSAPVSFFDTGGYGGLLLNAHDLNLGSTIVTIRGNQACTTGAPGSSVERCFYIQPSDGTGRNATARFYFSADELGSIPCADVLAWRWDGSAWVSPGTLTTRNCAAEPYYVEVTGVSDFSPFVLDDDTPNPPAPTAVELVSFTAVPEAGGVLLAWETAGELHILGFNVYRAGAPDGTRLLLNPSLIASQAYGSPAGSAYTWPDPAVTPGAAYYYWLGAVDCYGAETLSGPVSAIPWHTIYLPTLVRY